MMLILLGGGRGTRRGGMGIRGVLAGGLMVKDDKIYEGERGWYDSLYT